MIGYICKYTPIDLIEFLGSEPFRIEPSVKNFDKADALMHPNMCTYSKAALEEILSSGIDELILVNCCDSIKRLYDVLKAERKIKFLYLMDLPRKNGTQSIEIFKDEIIKFINAYTTYTGNEFDKDKFEKYMYSINYKKEDKNIKGIRIALAGARCKNSVKDLIEKCGADIIHDYTCTGTQIKYSKLNNGMDIMTWYAENILKQFPCMRMADINERYSEFNNTDDVSGIIYHTIKFCDNYSFDYSMLKGHMNVPILKIETDYTDQCEGQIKTRVEAFIESIKTATVDETSKKNQNTIKSSERIITAGIDSGSTSTNVVIINDEFRILSFSIVRTGAKSILSAEKAFEEALSKAHLQRDDISFIISTGYGRVSIPFANMNVTEITCHGKGAHFINKDIRTIIDIGGQDSKVIRLDDSGNIIDFAMNDKCAAGTGRFLEMMARTLEIPLSSMGRESEGWKEQIAITSICTVFAESEVVSLIAQNKNKSDIIHGLNNSIASKIIGMLDRIGRKPQYMMSGGVAKNIGVVKTIEEKLGEKVYIYDEPEIVGALGAALIALEKSQE
jgi:predicted CoA-substrate-specific enzyme activase